MTPAQWIAIIAAAVLALLGGTFGLIKTMMLGDIRDIKNMVSGLVKDVHAMDIRLTRLETEHGVEMRHPMFCRRAADLEEGA